MALDFLASEVTLCALIFFIISNLQLTKGSLYIGSLLLLVFEGDIEALFLLAGESKSVVFGEMLLVGLLVLTFLFGFLSDSSDIPWYLAKAEHTRLR